MTVEDMSEDMQLITDSYDIARIFYDLGYTDINIDEIEDPDLDFWWDMPGSLFVLTSDGDYHLVYSCESSIPRIDPFVEKLYPVMCTKCKREVTLGDYQSTKGEFGTEFTCRDCWE